jgi:hypothetical protein
VETYTLDDLCAMLCSPDPVIRDKTAYGLLWDRIARGDVDGGLAALGDQQADRLGHPEIQARTFAPLVLVAVLLRDEVTRELDPARVHRWLGAFVDWYTGEDDLRGYDDKLGWLHAVAHGADAVEAFSRSRHVSRVELVRLLEAVAARLVTPTGYLFAHGEDDRVGSAVVALLLRDDLSAADATEWLTPLRTALANGEPGPFPCPRSNAIRTLNSLYVACHRGVRLYDPAGRDRPVAWPPHQKAVLDAVADCLRGPLDYLG